MLRLALLLFPLAALAQPVQPERTFTRTAATDVRAERWIVVAAHPLAAEAGAEVLREGGSAADAAVAVQLALTLVEPQSSGLGGGAFALHWDAAARSLTAWDGREMAPASAGPDYWMRDGAPKDWREAVPGGLSGGLSVGVPGTPTLLQALHDAHGTRSRARLAAPAIRLAEEGFPIFPAPRGLGGGGGFEPRALSRDGRLFPARRRSAEGGDHAPQPGAGEDVPALRGGRRGAILSRRSGGEHRRRRAGRAGQSRVDDLARPRNLRGEASTWPMRISSPCRRDC